MGDGTLATTPQNGLWSAPRVDGIFDGASVIQGVRSMDVATGTWTTPDAYGGSAATPLSQSPYAYDKNNRLSHADSSGFDPTTIGNIITNGSVDCFVPSVAAGQDPTGGSDAFVAYCTGSRDAQIVAFDDSLKGARNAKCPPNAPPGVDIQQNIRVAYIKGALLPLPFKLRWFKGQFGGGPWDYALKNHDLYDDFSNFNYGATGIALGLTSGMLLRAAGIYQRGGHGPGEVPPNIFWGGKPPYGDDERGQYFTQQGIDYISLNPTFNYTQFKCSPVKPFS